MGNPPNDMPIYDRQAVDLRGTHKQPFVPNVASAQPSKKSQDWNIGEYE